MTKPPRENPKQNRYFVYLSMPARFTTSWLKGTYQKTNLSRIFDMPDSQPHRLLTSSDILRGVRIPSHSSSCPQEVVIEYFITYAAIFAFAASPGERGAV